MTGRSAGDSETLLGMILARVSSEGKAAADGKVFLFLKGARPSRFIINLNQISVDTVSIVVHSSTNHSLNPIDYIKEIVLFHRYNRRKQKYL